MNTQRGKGRSPLSRRIDISQHRGSAGTGNRWKVSSFHRHIVLPPPVSFWSFHYKSDRFFFSSLFQVWSLSLKKKQPPNLCILPSRPFPEYSIFKVLWLRPHLTLFDEALTEKTTLEACPPPVLGRALLSTAATHPVPTSLQRSSSTIPGTCAALDDEAFLHAVFSSWFSCVINKQM